MVNWDEAGKTWPQPHPHAARLLRGLLWGQHYRHSNPQCEGGMPGSFELREDMGEDRLRAVEDWLRVKGYAYRFRRKRWRVWTRLEVLPWVVVGAGGLGAGKTSGAGTRGVSLDVVIGGRTGHSDTNGGESSNN